MNFKLSIVFLGIISICLLGSTSKTKPIEYLGQQCPPDMVYIKGNDSMASFFMSKSQETNMNYVIYLEWLKDVYYEFPEIATNAEPAYSPLTNLHHFNDPIISYSLRHPALANYPVVGVSWAQANRYTEWKTDRMNEFINLQINGIEEFDYLKETNNENNFNTEAFLNGQYYPHYDKNKNLDYISPDNISLSRNTPYFFTGYRLPTEEELDYAVTQNQTYTESIDYIKFNYLKTFTNIKNKEMQNYLQNIEPYQSKSKNEIKGLDNVLNYNICNNIKEWTIDVYSENKKHYNLIGEVFNKNNFKLEHKYSNYYDPYGDYKAKDSIGRMGFRIMGVLPNGKDLKVDNYNIKLFGNYVEKLNPDSIIHSKIYANEIAVLNLDGIGIKFPTNSKDINYLNDYLNYINKRDSISKIMYDTIIKYRVKAYYYKLDIDSSQILFRTVKSGTWKNPSIINREKLQELFGNSEIGFRCVMQYNGFPIQPKYRVNWQKPIKLAKTEKKSKVQKSKVKKFPSPRN